MALHRYRPTSNAAVQIATGARWLELVRGYNVSGSPHFVHFYDLAAGSVVPGTTIPLLTIVLPKDTNQAAGSAQDTLWQQDFTTALSISVSKQVTGAENPDNNAVLVMTKYA